MNDAIGALAKIGHSEFGKKTGDRRWKPLGWSISMFEYDEEDGRLHRSITRSPAPRTATRTSSNPDPSKAFAKAYDMR